MSETRKSCCYGLCSLEKGSTIIAIFGLIIAFIAFIGHLVGFIIPKFAIYRFSFYDDYTLYYLILVDITLSVGFNLMLIHGIIIKEKSVYLTPWIILNVLNLLAVSELKLPI